MAGWSTRRKRHGGVAFINAKRARQMALLGKENPEDDVVKGCYVFLTENPNRVLSPAIEEHFGWPKLT